MHPGVAGVGLALLLRMQSKHGADHTRLSVNIFQTVNLSSSPDFKTCAKCGPSLAMKNNLMRPISNIRFGSSRFAPSLQDASSTERTHRGKRAVSSQSSFA